MSSIQGRAPRNFLQQIIAMVDQNLVAEAIIATIDREVQIIDRIFYLKETAMAYLREAPFQAKPGEAVKLVNCIVARLGVEAANNIINPIMHRVAEFNQRARDNLGAAPLANRAAAGLRIRMPH